MNFSERILPTSATEIVLINSNDVCYAPEAGIKRLNVFVQKVTSTF